MTWVALWTKGYCYLKRRSFSGTDLQNRWWFGHGNTLSFVPHPRIFFAFGAVLARCLSSANVSLGIRYNFLHTLLTLFSSCTEIYIGSVKGPKFICTTVWWLVHSLYPYRLGNHLNNLRNYGRMSTVMWNGCLNSLVQGREGMGFKWYLQVIPSIPFLSRFISYAVMSTLSRIQKLCKIYLHTPIQRCLWYISIWSAFLSRYTYTYIGKSNIYAMVLRKFFSRVGPLTLSCKNCNFCSDMVILWE